MRWNCLFFPSGMSHLLWWGERGGGRVFMDDSALVIRNSLKQRLTKNLIPVNYCSRSTNRGWKVFVCCPAFFSRSLWPWGLTWRTLKGETLLTEVIRELIKTMLSLWLTRQNENRKGRFFFVSTKTLSTTSQCFVTDTTLTACAAKRRRNLILEAEDSEGLIKENISPMAANRWRQVGKVKEVSFLASEWSRNLTLAWRMWRKDLSVTGGSCSTGTPPPPPPTRAPPPSPPSPVHPAASPSVCVDSKPWWMYWHAIMTEYKM